MSTEDASVGRFIARHIGAIVAIVFGAGMWGASVKFLYEKSEFIARSLAESNINGSQYAREAVQRNAQNIEYLAKRVDTLEEAKKTLTSIQSDVQQIKGWVEELKKKSQ